MVHTSNPGHPHTDVKVNMLKRIQGRKSYTVGDSRSTCMLASYA